MRRRIRLTFPWLMSAAIAGCGGEPVGRGAGTGAGGHGGAMATSSSAGSSSGGGFDPATTAASSSSGGFMGCPIVLDRDNFWIDVIGDGPVQTLQDGCGEDPVPVIQIAGGGECGYGLYARACATPAGGAIMNLYAPGLLDPGTSDAAFIHYRTGDGVDYEAQNGQLVLDELGDVGSTGKGSYSATVVNQADGTTTLSISGDFVLCHIPDGPPCP